jgi:hypothetical protein
MRAALTTVLCLAGVAFYMRFLVALCKDRKAHWIFYWVRLHGGCNEYSIPERRERKKPVARAA